MRVAVAGLWHLGAVTAACCASGKHEVVAFDEDLNVVNNLQDNRLPVEEPGLVELTASEQQSGRLRFTSEPSELSTAEVLWACYDTPVDENDIADTDYVTSRITALLPYLPSGALVLISSQMPVGSTGKLEKSAPHLEFAYSPENLRLGQAIRVFTKPDRVIIGVRPKSKRARIESLFAPFTNKLEWMSVESAEMTKHALNAFLATSVVFANEMATICERTGADAQEVERGLKSDARIGPGAYLHPGSAFAGGTLARDISFLLSFGKVHGIATPLFRGVMESNSAHKLWMQHQLSERVGDLQDRLIGVLGVTYKPGTNTLRRSSSMEVCRWLIEQGADVRAFDPAVISLPKEYDNRRMQLMNSAESVLENAEAVLIATPWPEFLSIPASAFLKKMHRKLVLDPGRHLETVIRPMSEIEYVAIGVGV